MYIERDRLGISAHIAMVHLFFSQRVLQSADRIQVDLSTGRDSSRGAVDHWPGGPQAVTIAVSICHHTLMPLQKCHHLLYEHFNLIRIRARRPRLIVHTRKLAHPNRLLVFSPVVFNILFHARHIGLVRVYTCVVPRWVLRCMFKGCEPAFVFLGRETGRTEKGAFCAEGSNEGGPGAGGGGGSDFGRVGRSPVRFVETHHVFWGHCQRFECCEARGVIAALMTVAPKLWGVEKLAIVSQDLGWVSCEGATPWRIM